MPFSSGYIEGYYGRLLSWDERDLIVNTLASQHLTTYLYAPKEDPWHRHSWRQAYPSTWRREFRAFVTRSHRRRVSVIPALAPGLSFDYTNRSDYASLLRKLRAFINDEARTVALLMDDIPDELPRACRGSFRSLGEAHGKLLTRLRDDILEVKDDVGLWFCPTVYCDHQAHPDVLRSVYLRDLAATMPADVPLLWTGPNVISPRLDAAALAEILGLFPGRVIIWDNLYANDYCPRRLFFGPYAGRTRELTRVTSGVLLNSTGMAHTDALQLHLLGGFVKGRNPDAVWREVIDGLEYSPEIRAVASFFDSPFVVPESRDLAARRTKALRAALKPLIWDWKSPLQREWYPFLYMLDADLQLAEGSRDVAWTHKKYPPPLSAILAASRNAR